MDSTGLKEFEGTPGDPPRRRRANDLDGKDWTRYSISVWNDLKKSPEEVALKHPASFPESLVERLIRCFLPPGGGTVLDPFAGSGSTLAAASRLGCRSVGFEIAGSYAELARQRLERLRTELPESGDTIVYTEPAAHVLQVLGPETVDLCITSPPYWNILAQRRTADFREVRDYAGGTEDLSDEPDYERFLDRLTRVFSDLAPTLKPGAYCVINVMDLRKKDQFFPLHADLLERLRRDTSLELDDLIVWDRRKDYNSLRPLGYPAVFRINKIHEFLLIFRRPRSKRSQRTP